MKFRTEVSIVKDGFNLNVADNIVLLGSCFTKNIGTKLVDYKFNCDVNAFGVLYNPMSICRSLDSLLSGEDFPYEKYLFQNGEIWNSWLHSGDFSAPAREQCLHNIRKRAYECNNAIKNAHALILTFGTNRCYEYNVDGSYVTVANCHKIPEQRFNIHDMTVEEVISVCEKTLTELFKLNEHLQVLFTVSPYRYAKYGFHGSNLSKSVLLLAVDEIIKHFCGKCFYFPSYEIVNDELRDYRFYTDDMLHPSTQAVDYIFERFSEYAFSDETFAFAQEWKKIVKAINHRPNYPDTKEYRAFVEKTQERLVFLSKKYANLAVEKEVEELNNVSAANKAIYN